MFCLLLILIANNILGQLPLFDKIPTQEGDVNLSVRQVLQDKQGFLWLATFSGLYRFEGDDFILQHQFLGSSKINADVNALLEDWDNNIWIGTNDGLSRYNPETSKLVTYRYQKNKPNSLGSNKIRSLAIDSLGRVWIGTSDKGLLVYNPENDSFSSIQFENQSNINPTYIKTIFIEDNRKIWLGTLGDGLFCFTYNNSTIDTVLNYRKENSVQLLSDNNVYDIYKDIDGTMVVGTRSGLNVFNSDLNQFEDVSSESFLPGSLANYFRSVLRDTNGKLWIGTWGGLILCNTFKDIKTGDFQLIRHDRNAANSIVYNQIMDVFQDKSGVIWLATENGLNRYDPYFNQFRPLLGESFDNLVEQTATDFGIYDNEVLMLMLSDGLLLRQNGQFRSFCQKDNKLFQKEKCYSLCVDSEKNVWIGTANGLLIKLDNKNIQSYYKHSDENTPIYSIIELEKGKLAIGTFGDGVKYFNVRTGNFKPDRGLSATVQVNDIYLDTRQRLWVATQLGIFKKKYKKRFI